MHEDDKYQNQSNAEAWVWVLERRDGNLGLHMYFYILSSYV